MTFDDVNRFLAGRVPDLERERLAALVLAFFSAEDDVEVACDRYLQKTETEIDSFLASRVDAEEERAEIKEAIGDIVLLGEPIEEAFSRYRESRPPPSMRFDRVEILADTDATRITQEAITALKRRGGIYQRSGILVEPRLDPARKLKGLLRPAEELKMVEIHIHRMRSLLAEACRFFIEKKDEQVDVHVPEWLPGDVVYRPDWPGIPVVESLSENPTLRADGTIHDTPGYDSNTGNYFSADGVVFQKILDQPTIEDAKRAFNTLMDPFCDFPFVADYDKSVACAIVLTMLARNAIAGPTPPFVIQTSTPRTGKDLLTDVLTIIGTGRQTPGRSLPDNDVEFTKLLLSLGISSARVVSFGNCEGLIGSPALSHAVTRELIGDRLLGANRDVTVALRPVWLFNGNNPYFRSDFGPRVILLTMDAEMEDPQARSGWKHDPLLSYVKRERPRLVAAGLTILRAYCVAGKPKHGRSKRGSFESWDDLIRGALIWLGAADPCAGVVNVRTMADADLDKLRALLSAWRDAFKDRAITLAEVVEASRAVAMFGSGRGADIPPNVRRDLSNALASLDAKFGDRYTASSIGYAIRHHKNRRLDVVGIGQAKDTLRLTMVANRAGSSKVGTWRVLDEASKDTIEVVYYENVKVGANKETNGATGVEKN